MSDPPEPELDAAQRDEFLRGVAQFNGGYFFECHDTLEELWSGLRGPSRDFFQGLIQVSVAFYHLGNGNAGGALSMLERARRRFAAYPDRYMGFDLDAHRAELETWRRCIEGGDTTGVSRRNPPSWRFEEPVAAGARP